MYLWCVPQFLDVFYYPSCVNIFSAVNFVNKGKANIFGFLGFDGGLPLSYCVSLLPHGLWLQYCSTGSFPQSWEAYNKGCTEAVDSYSSPVCALHWRCWPTIPGKILVSAVKPLLQYCSLTLQTTLWAQCMKRYPWHREQSNSAQAGLRLLFKTVSDISENVH